MHNMHNDIEDVPPFWNQWNQLDAVGKLALPYSNLFVTGQIFSTTYLYMIHV